MKLSRDRVVEAPNPAVAFSNEIVKISLRERSSRHLEDVKSNSHVPAGDSLEKDVKSAQSNTTEASSKLDSDAEGIQQELLEPRIEIVEIGNTSFGRGTLIQKAPVALEIVDLKMKKDAGAGAVLMDMAAVESQTLVQIAAPHD